MTSPYGVNMAELAGRRSPIQQALASLKTRSRSLSPPRSPSSCDSELVFMNSIYRERFPNAKLQMEERLRKFLDVHLEPDEAHNADSIARFVHHHLVELAQDCLQKSQDNHLACAYFYEMSAQLEKLTVEVSPDKWGPSKAPETHSFFSLLLFLPSPLSSLPSPLSYFFFFDFISWKKFITFQRL